MSNDYKGESRTRCPWQTSEDTRIPVWNIKLVILLFVMLEDKQVGSLMRFLTCCLKSFSWAFVLWRKRFRDQSPDVKALNAFSKLSCFLKRSMVSFSSSCRPLIGRNLQGCHKNSDNQKLNLRRMIVIISSCVIDLPTWCSFCEFESPGTDPGWGSWSDHRSHTTPSQSFRRRAHSASLPPDWLH